MVGLAYWWGEGMWVGMSRNQRRRLMRKMKLPGDTTALTEMRRSLARFMLYEVPNKETYTAGKYQLTRVKKS